MGRDSPGKANWKTVQREAEDLAARVACHPAVQQVSAAALQLGVSCSAYNLSLAAFHVAGGVLRIHCATPLLGSAWGLLAVAAASASAGHVSRATLAALQRGGGGLAATLRELPQQLVGRWDAREAAVDAVLGPVVFKLLLRHDFRRLLPSHLAKPGAFGRMAVPTGSTEYATATEKGQLSVLFGRDGCHHCGTRVNGVIGDHQPPYKVVKDVMAAREHAGGLEKALRGLADRLGLKDTSLLQVYYAQCKGCSGRQAQLMRNGTRTTLLPGVWPPQLVLHAPGRLATRPALPGALVGMRYYVDAAVRHGPGPSGSSGSSTSKAGATGPRRQRWFRMGAAASGGQVSLQQQVEDGAMGGMEDGQAAGLLLHLFDAVTSLLLSDERKDEGAYARLLVR